MKLNKWILTKTLSLFDKFLKIVIDIVFQKGFNSIRFHVVFSSGFTVMTVHEFMKATIISGASLMQLKAQLCQSKHICCFYHSS